MKNINAIYFNVNILKRVYRYAISDFENHLCFCMYTYYSTYYDLFSCVVSNNMQMKMTFHRTYKT